MNIIFLPLRNVNVCRRCLSMCPKNVLVNTQLLTLIHGDVLMNTF